MAVRVMKARFADTCRECGGAIEVGESINYGGRGAVSHGPDERGEGGCRPLAAVRTRYGRRVYGGYENTGRRCIDAPCCGCC